MKRPDHSIRDSEIIAAIIRGATYAKAGAIGGVSGERARQIYVRAQRMAHWNKLAGTDPERYAEWARKHPEWVLYHQLTTEPLEIEAGPTNGHGTNGHG